MAHIIVVGNEKGGAGKSTVSMHVATALARMGHRVGTLDLDLRQRSLARYVENRAAFIRAEGLALPSATTGVLPGLNGTPPADDAAPDLLAQAVEALAPESEFILIDCPGAHTPLAQAGHALADTLVTPLNDSFVDFDLLARTDPSGEKVLGPSVYSEMVWTARQRRAQAGGRPIDWIVLRNRVGSQRMRNKDRMERAVANLSRRIGFRVAPGFSERVVFRELFPRGLTLLDLPDTGIKQLSLSGIAARQELRDLVRTLNLPGVEVTF